MTRQPEATDTATMHLARVPRPGGDRIGSTDAPSRDLLPGDGHVVPAPVPAPARALALDALRVLRRLRDPARRSDGWAQPSFRRAHLAPLRTRRALAASYGREAFHLAMDAGRDDPGAVRMAYALRWLELGDGDVGPIWPPAAARERVQPEAGRTSGRPRPTSPNAHPGEP